MSNGFYEVYDPQTGIYHEYGSRAAAERAPYNPPAGDKLTIEIL